MENPLSKRETEISSMMIRGLQASAIARKLDLSINTVQNHQRAIKQKLKSKNAFQTGASIFLNFEIEKIRQKILEIIVTFDYLQK